MQKKVDLHLHSYRSDGSYSPTEIVKKAKEAALSALSLTDHDTVSGLSEAREEAKRLEILFLNGVELSAADDSGEVHILGYGFDSSAPALLSRLEALQENRRRRNEMIVAALCRAGAAVELSEVQALAQGGVLTRAHFAMALKDRGYVTTANEAFERYLNPGRPGYIPRKKMSLEEAVSLIRAAGGVAVLAHPFQYTGDIAVLEAILRRGIAAGLCGMECYYARYDKGQTKTLLHLAKRYGLIATGGSDFHGAFKPGLLIGSGYGNLIVPFSAYEDLLAALE